jgi:hypothetical protein
MNALKTTYVASALALLVTGMAASPVHAFQDDKSLSPMRCQPLGPNTTASELTLSHNGIYNPGSTAETVTCEMPMDAEYSWTASPGNSGAVIVYYSTGSVSGKVACTLYVGSTQQQSTPVYSATQAPAISAPYTRASLSINLSYPSTTPTYVLIPVNLECTLAPKTTLAAMYFHEAVATNQ